MSGIFYEGHWYENTDMVCKLCGNPVYQSDHAEYSYQCFHCNEDIHSFEVAEQDCLDLPKVAVARPINGITLNGGVEYLLDESGEIRVFHNQPEAEKFLLANGFVSEDLEFLYFVEVHDGAA